MWKVQQDFGGNKWKLSNAVLDAGETTRKRKCEAGHKHSDGMRKQMGAIQTSRQCDKAGKW